MTRTRLAIVAIAGTVAVAGCGDASVSPGPSASPSTDPCVVDDLSDTTLVTVDGTPSLTFEPSVLSAPAGDVAITLVNTGPVPHSLVIEGSPLRLFTPLQDDTCTGITTLEAGTHEFWCDVPGHRDLGMEGTLTVN